MRLSAYLSLVLRNIWRSKTNLVMSCFGIIVGISTLVFFIGLSEGVKKVVLGEIFLVDQVEVIPKSLNLGLTQTEGGMILDDETADEIAALDGVKAVYPKMKFTFPARGVGGAELFPKKRSSGVRFELIADGLNPELVAHDLKHADDFQDWDLDRDEQECANGETCPGTTSCVNGLCQFACAETSDCIDGRTCIDGACERNACTYSEKTYKSVCQGRSYCGKDTKVCETPIPAVASYHALELFNGGLATGLGLDRIAEETLIGMEGDAYFGQSMLRIGSKSGKSFKRRMRLVGFTNMAINVGTTVPLGYVKRLNGELTDEDASEEYHSIIVKVEDQKRVPELVEAIKSMDLDLAESTKNAEKAAKIILTTEIVFTLISLIIVGIAAVNISQMFFMLIYQRKRELGLFRAVGGSKNHVRFIILGEASLIGALGGSLGALTGYGLSVLADRFAAQAPDFPYKPESFFAFPWWIWASALGIAILFCLVGAIFPAEAAAHQEPAAALTE